MPVNLGITNTSPPTLEEFEINPSQASNISLGAANRHYQVSNLIVQDNTRTGILQFFPDHSEQEAEPTTVNQTSTSTRPDRTGGSNTDGMGRSGDTY